MLEIIAIIIFSDKISTKARLKGHLKTGRFVLLFISFWFLFEIIGSIVGVLVFQHLFVQYIFSISFAILGGFLSFKIVDLIKANEILKEYDTTIQVDSPFIIQLWKEQIITILTIFILTALLMVYISYYLIVIPLIIFIFSKYGIYKIIFGTDDITIKYIYGRNKIIEKKQIVNLVLNNKLMIEIHWKKSSKHSTKSIKFTSNAFMQKNIPTENIKSFLQSLYKNV